MRKTPRTATKTPTKATGVRGPGKGGKAGSTSRRTGPGRSAGHRSTPGKLPATQTLPEGGPVAQKHLGEVTKGTTVDSSVQDEDPTLGKPGSAQRTRRKHRAATKNAGPAAGPQFQPAARAHPPKPTERNGGIAGNAARAEAGPGAKRGPTAPGPNRFVLQRRERQAQRRFAEIVQHAGKANLLEKASQTPMWAPAAPLRKNTYIGSPGPWNETPRVDGNAYRGKPMPPELAPGLDLGLQSSSKRVMGGLKGSQRSGRSEARASRALMIMTCTRTFHQRCTMGRYTMGRESERH